MAQRISSEWTCYLVVISLLACVAFHQNVTIAQQPSARPKKLTLALYPYVPRLDQFKTAVSQAWKKRHKDVELEFVFWDCYSKDPPKNLDVFVFDAIFLDCFQDKGFLEPLADREVDEKEDLLKYAREGVKFDGRFFGIPQLGCASILFYRKSDKAMNSASSLSEIIKTIGINKYTDLKPPAGVGLMIYLGGGTTSACHYLDAVEDIYSVYAPNPPLPQDSNRISDWAIANVRQLLAASSVKNAKHYDYDKPYERAAWFSQGLGRAFVGYTESMSSLTEEARRSIAFKLLPLSDRRGVSLFYSDVVGINSSLSSASKKRKLAVELANLISSTEVMLASIGPTKSQPYPQYIMPVRHSVFAKLGAKFPLYVKMYDLVKQSDPKLFRIGPNSRDWLKSMKSKVRDEVFATAP